MNKSGLVGISISRSRISRCIQWFRDGIVFDDEDNIATHCFVTFGELQGEVILGEATDPKIRLAQLKQFFCKTGKRFELYRIPDLAPKKRDAALKDLMKLTGKNYGYIQLLGFIYVWALFKLGIKANNPVSKDDIIVCSKYCFRYLTNISYKDKELMNMKARNVAPDNIHKSLKAHAKLVAYSDFNDVDIMWL